jgi:hypothetical protein
MFVLATLGLAHVRHLVVLRKTSDLNRQLAFQAFDTPNTYFRLSRASSSCQWHMNLHFRVKSFDPAIIVRHTQTRLGRGAYLLHSLRRELK